jgi:uncharacterized protein YdaU (DUF1376 family)
MALRDQPYLPLYVQDFLTDEKLMECSASATGIYIRLICIMHKSDEYGVILLKQKDKQTNNQIKNFALKLAKYLPYSTDEIISGLTELINEGVLQNGGDRLSQKRMIKDNEISIVRAYAGKKGGLKTQLAKTKEQAKGEANTEIDTVNINEDIDINSKKNGMPKLEEVKAYCKERNNDVDPIRWYNFYESKGWMIGKNKMKDWRAAVRTWEKGQKEETFTERKMREIKELEDKLNG